MTIKQKLKQLIEEQKQKSFEISKMKPKKICVSHSIILVRKIKTRGATRSQSRASNGASILPSPSV